MRAAWLFSKQDIPPQAPVARSVGEYFELKSQSRSVPRNLTNESRQRKLAAPLEAASLASPFRLREEGGRSICTLLKAFVRRSQCPLSR